MSKMSSTHRGKNISVVTDEKTRVRVFLENEEVPSFIEKRNNKFHVFGRPFERFSSELDAGKLAVDALIDRRKREYVRSSAVALLKSDQNRLLRFIHALMELKHRKRRGSSISIYDEFVATHLGVVGLTFSKKWLEDQRLDVDDISGLAKGFAAGRDGGHRGPGFLPWHREYLRRLELELQKVDAGVTIPYWDWTHHGATKGLFTKEFMGPTGTQVGNRYPVQSGFFSYDNWPILPELHYRAPNGVFGPLENVGKTLQRNLRSWDELAGAAHVKQATDQTRYDNLAGGPPEVLDSFREILESGDRLHGWGHVWVGESMALMSSPNDPIFFMHHANVDRIWAEWQAGQRETWEKSNPGKTYVYETHYYNPQTDNPEPERDAGHKLNDPMWPWDGGASKPARYIPGQQIISNGQNIYDQLLAPLALPENMALPTYSESRTPADVLDYWGQLRYTYDTLLKPQR